MHHLQLLFLLLFTSSSMATSMEPSADSSTCEQQQTLTLNTGHEIPIIALGVYQSAPGEETYNACLAALELGYRHIDTAAMYGNEEAVGRAVRDSKIPREEIFITTKFWPEQGMQALQTPGSGYEAAIVEGEASNSKLGLGYIDLYLIHAPAWGKERINVWRGFEELVKRGVVKSIGVSNYGIKHLNEIISNEYTIPSVNQIELHPFMLHDGIETYCKKKGIVIEAYAPLAQATRLNDSILINIAKKHDKTAAQVMLRWGLQRGFVILPKSVRKVRIKENKSIDDFELTKNEMIEINSLDEYKGTSWDPTIWE